MFHPRAASSARPRTRAWLTADPLTPKSSATVTADVPAPSQATWAISARAADSAGRCRRRVRDADHQVVVVDEQRPGEQVHVRRPEHPREPLDEEPPVIVAREERPAFVPAPDDAEQVAGLPEASLSRHTGQGRARRGGSDLGGGE